MYTCSKKINIVHSAKMTTNNICHKRLQVFLKISRTTVYAYIITAINNQQYLSIGFPCFSDFLLDKLLRKQKYKIKDIKERMREAKKIIYNKYTGRERQQKSFLSFIRAYLEVFLLIFRQFLLLNQLICEFLQVQNTISPGPQTNFFAQAPFVRKGKN